MRLIDADALHKSIDTETYRHTYIEQIHEVIDKAPTIDAEPKTGEWILECDGGNECDNLYKCSTCGVECGCEEYDKPNFCPNCGADMRGDTE